MFVGSCARMLFVCTLLAGCQRPAGIPAVVPDAAVTALNQSAPPKAESKTIDLGDWQKRWQLSASSEPASEPGDPSPPLLAIQTHLPPASQRELLTELATSPLEQRLRLINELLETAEAQRVPIEYACQATVQGDPKIRDRIWQELLAARLTPEKLGESGSEPAIRAAIELGLCDRLPGVTTVAVKLILKNEPAIIPNDKRRMQDELLKEAFQLWLLEAAQQAPASEQPEVTTLLLGAPSTPVRPPRIDQFNSVIIDPRDNRQRMLEAIRQRGLFGKPSLGLPLTDAELAQLRDGNAALPALLNLLQNNNFKPALLSVDEQRGLVSNLVSQAQRQPALIASVRTLLARHEMAMSPADRRVLIATTRPQAGQTADYNTTFQAAQLFAQAPGEEIAASFLELIETDSHLRQQFLPKTFKRLSADQAKELIRGLTPRVAQKDFTVLYAMILLKNQLEPADGEKLEQHLITQMKSYSLVKKPQPFPQDDRTKLAEALFFCDSLSPATITEVLELTYGAPEWNGNLQDALQSIGDRSLGGLLANYPAQLRASWLDRLQGLVRNENGLLAGREALLAIEKVSATLSPEEADKLIPPIVEKSDHETMYSITNVILNRPATDRLSPLKALARLLLQTKYETKGSPYESMAVFQLIELACGELPPDDTAAFAQYCLELRMKGRNHDQAAYHLLATAVRRVQPQNQPAIGKWIASQLDSPLATYQLFALAAAAKAMPQALNDSGKQKLATELTRRALQALKATTVRPDENFEEGTINVLKHVADNLQPLLRSLPENDTRPAVETLLDALAHHQQRVDEITELMPVFASLPGEYSPARMQQLADIYLACARQERQHRAMQLEFMRREIRGILPAGAGQKQWQYAIDANLNPAQRWLGLHFISEHLHPDDVAACLRALESSSLDPGNTLRICGNLTKNLSVKDAEEKFLALQKSSEAAQNSALLKCQAAAFLRPVARENPVRFMELLDSLKLDPTQKSVAVQFLADCTNRQQLADLVLSQIKKGERLDGSVTARLSAPARLLVIDTLEAEKNPKWASYAAFIRQPGYAMPIETQLAKELLRAPDCVGARRLTVHKLTQPPQLHVTRWQMLQ